MQPIAWSRREAAAVAGAGGLAAAAALYAYFTDPRRPTAAVAGNGWWSFSDQWRYLRATLAWSAGRLDPADHWYLPGYPLLAVPFTHLTHSNPFLFPDLAFLAATIWLAAAIAGWLAPGWRYARVAGAVAALASVLQPAAMDAWVTPWTSTPEAALTLAGLLATLHLTARPSSWRLAAAAGLCAGAIAGIRPMDAAVLSAVVAAAAGLALLRARPGWAATLRVLAAASGSGALAVAPTVAAYVAINGWHLNDYLVLSASIGFEWRLLPLRWVTIMLAPQPMFPDGQGLISAFPWMAAGFAGMSACLVAPPSHGPRSGHALIIGATTAHIALYLCYRDLHPQGLWRFYNYHYFKWPLVVLALYTVFLVRIVVERRFRALIAAAVAVALLLPWRVDVVPEAEPVIPAQTGKVLYTPAIALGVYDALVIPVQGTFDAIYGGEHNLYVGADEKWYGSTADFKVSPRPGGLLLTPLRPLQAGALMLRFGPGVTLAGDPAYLAHLHLTYGAPCWLPSRLHACPQSDHPGPWRHPGIAIQMDGQEGGVLGAGWSSPEPSGRWTEGSQAVLQMRLAPAAIHGLQLIASPFVPPGAAPLDLTIAANDRVIGRWSLADPAEQVLRSHLPDGVLGPDGALRITLTIANPRSPQGSLPGSTDTRLLGLRVRAVTIEP